MSNVPAAATSAAADTAERGEEHGMIRQFTITLALATAGAMLLTGCGEGMSTEDAQDECNDISAQLSQTCMTTAAYNSCVTCHEECGEACGTVETVCPYAFSCPED
jgi:hypothetical protein